MSDKNQIFISDIEDHFSQLVSNVLDYAIFLLDPKGYVKSWNAGAEHFKGYSADEIIGKHFSTFYTADAVARGWPTYELEMAAAEGRFEDEGWRVRKDGSTFWANVVITSIKDDQGNVQGFLKITRDLTERKRAEEQLRQSEERFRLLVSGVKDYAIFMLDTQGCVASWNIGAERIKGYTADEIIGKHFSIFYPSEIGEDDKAERELAAARESGSFEEEGWRARKDRSLFWANVVVTPLYDSQKKLIGYAKITRDMTEKRKVDALEIADRQKNEFLAMLAHELRNPLAPISNGLQLLKMPEVDPETKEHTRSVMERQLLHLVRLVDDLLDVSRIVTGKLSLNKQPVELSTIINRAIEETQAAIDARGHELMLSIPGRPILVDADVMRMAQVITNLLVNASKYSEQPSHIDLTVERRNSKVLIKVRDRGIGISAEMLPRIFQLFVQVDTSLAHSQGGLGVGLTVVKRIVEMHGGTAKVTSEGIGLGSEFSIELPISKANVPHTKLATAEPAQANQRRILVVDDNVDASLTITNLLQAWGHSVQVAFNGPSAIELAHSFQPEIMLLDIGLPGMSGYEVARQIRADSTLHGIVIAALTGYGQETDRSRAFEAGFNFHMTKPPDPAVLENLVTQSIR